MNSDPDYSAAYVVLTTGHPDLASHGLTFTIGRGNGVCCAAIEATRHLVVGLELDWIKDNPGRFWRHLIGDSQLPGRGWQNRAEGHSATGGLCLLHHLCRLARLQ
jgi:L-fuconate dehydratase